MEKKQHAIILILSLPLAILTAFVSYAGIFVPGTYAKETMNYAAQGVGQDMVNLFGVVPALIVSAVFASRKSKPGLLIWSGILFYLVYSYTIYGFGLHFGNLFLAYCFILGLSFYSFSYFIFISFKENVGEWFVQNTPTKSTGIFLIVIAIFFYFTWLSEIIPAMQAHITPKSVVESGLLINPVHVLDLAICLPALILTGVLLIKKKSLGLSLATPMLIFCILMATAIAAMILEMKSRGFEVDLTLPILFGLIALISCLLLVQYLSKLK
jgi:hypothetical protein